MDDETEERPENEGEKRSALIQSVSIAARFLNLLSRSDTGLALGELAKRAGTGRSTAHRYMQSLVREGLVIQDPASGSYDLGPAALGIGISALRRINPVETAGREMKALAAQIGASCGVAIWTERGPTVVRWARSASFFISLPPLSRAVRPLPVPRRPATPEPPRSGGRGGTRRRRRGGPEPPEAAAPDPPPDKTALW